MPQPVDLAAILNLTEFAQHAEPYLDLATYRYYADGTADDITLRENVAAFEALRLLPRYLVDVSTIDTAATLNGRTSALPVGIAPMAMMGLAHPQGDIALAKAAHTANIPFVLSTLAGTSIEEVAPHHDDLWFQLYVQKDRAVTADLVTRAEAAGFTALVVTVDVPVTGYRESLIRHPLTLTSNVTLANLTRYVQPDASQSLMGYVNSQFDPSLSWADIEAFAANTTLPVYVKGIMHPDDAKLAVQSGTKGVIVSNHGGRQLDTVPAAIDVLPAIAQAVGDSVPLILDGGVRRGTDIVKALAAGAQAVHIGRPFAFALAVGGEAGAARAIAIIRNELVNAMRLCGAPQLSAITSALLYR